jgi:hypothetical protein
MVKVLFFASTKYMIDEQEIPEGTPLIMAASSPLKLFAKDGRDRWNPTLEQINTAPMIT